MRILLAEDERSLSRAVTALLERNHYAVDAVYDGAEALDYLEGGNYDALTLDIMMPKMDGFELVESMKEFKDVPCIMLTAKGESKDKLRGFSSGVDDYVVKPFDPNELMARVKAIMKRYDINTSHIVRLNEVELDGDKYEIRYKDECIHLPLKQFELLFELAKHPNQIFSREQLIEKIWGMDYDGFDRTVDVHIKRIRENIGHLPGFNVVTVRGLGYKVEVD